MKKRIYMLILIQSLLLTSCDDDSLYMQDDWHIDTIGLADEYFPKYFDAIENSLLKNNINYEKEYFEQDIKGSTKNYSAVYHVTDSMSFSARFAYEYRAGSFSHVSLYFYDELSTERDMLNLQQNYLNVMIDTANFCANNFVGKGEIYNSLYSEVIEKYNSKDYTYVSDDSDYFAILEYESIGVLPYIKVEMISKDTIYKLSICLVDYLTDINIWDK